MDILAAVNQIVMMLLIMAVGFWLRKIAVLDAHMIKGISNLVIKVAMPALVFVLIQKESGTDGRMAFLGTVILVIVWISLTTLIVFWGAKKMLPPENQAVFAALSVMSNSGFMGLPIIAAIYGDQGAFYLSAVVVGFNVTVYLTLEYIMTGKHPRPKVLLGNVGLMMTFLALLTYVFRVRLPLPLSAMATHLGALTTPLTMLIAGARLTDFKLSALKDASLWLAMAFKLLIIPIVSFALFRALGFEGVQLGVITMAFAMASAASTQMFAEREGKNTLLAATGISVSTILCLVTIPLVMLITGI
ncbi:MAG: hypothetical protein GX858_04590 [Clostridiales bacterium]|nr:hypothetical protein [Clostridiales bacterium]